ncbi:LysR family transcriptional regulator [Phyllobacterium sp. SB3]|uniref:LysR family transcriptional regulator n=1 Tax=Phyllobacterium sp. SB3 TaxID=3156073 RepID=UPI0032AFBDE5
MELQQLRCFIAAADEFHFGKAAQRLDMLPSSLGRHIKQLEDDLGTRLISRTTRSVTLTEDGIVFLEEARRLLAHADRLAAKMRAESRDRGATLRIGSIDSAAAGLIPQLIHDFRGRAPHVGIELLEDKSVRLLPKLLSGRLDLVFIRPPANPSRRLDFFFLLYESAVVALPIRHRFADRSELVLADLVDEPLIVPDRHSRPHSHDLTVKLFNEAGLTPRISQIAEEKQTIIGLVAAELGAAIVPRWTSRLSNAGVKFVRLTTNSTMGRLPLSAAWARGSRDGVRDQMLDMIRENLSIYSANS